MKIFTAGQKFFKDCAFRMALVLLSAFAVPLQARADGSALVSIGDLTAAPDAYHGKAVVLEGIYYADADILCAPDIDLSHHYYTPAGCVDLEPAGKNSPPWRAADGRHVTVRGVISVFDCKGYTEPCNQTSHRLLTDNEKREAARNIKGRDGLFPGPARYGVSLSGAEIAGGKK